MRLNFGKPKPFDDGSWEDGMSGGPGAYRLIAWNPTTNEAKTIDRAFGKDPDGVLDIGESQNLWGRLVTMRQAMRYGKASHSAGLKYHYWGYADVWPLTHLRIQFVLVPSKDQAVAAEAVAIGNYLRGFKDLPPLNSTMGNRAKTAKWIEKQGRPAFTPDGYLNLEGLLPDRVLVVG